jgi:acetylornithine deacetylase/succinyl-diaminopimelate desuccinylase-like protein
MTRIAAIARTEHYFDEGAFKADLARRVAIPTESQNRERAADLARYIDSEMVPAFRSLGFACRVLTHAKARGPILFAERSEGAGLPVALGYGHGDVIRGFEGSWKDGTDPWRLVEADGR